MIPKSLNKQLLLALLATNIIFAALFFVWQNYHEKKAITEQMKLEARGIYHYVVLTRQLISKWEGVYVHSDGGYIRKTPSSFTKALADLGHDKNTPFSIKLALDGNMDPDHAPDNFEQMAIRLMKQRGILESWEITEEKERRIFRYAGPLVFESDCTTCHAGKQREGVIGCITVSLNDADRFYGTLREKNIYAALFFTAACGIAMVILWALLNRLVLSPLGSLDRAAKKVQRGQFDIRLKLDSSTEWKCVGASFNNMVRALERQQSILQEEVNKAVANMKEAYEELKRTEKYKADFFTNITHDLKTPITAMKGALSILRHKKIPHEESPYLDILERNCTKLASMVQDILDCTRLDSDSLELDLKPTDLAELMEDTILMAIPLAWEKKIEIRYHVPEYRCNALIDAARMEQVMANLLSNAIKFSPQGSTVSVRMEPAADIRGDEQTSSSDAEYWIISVKDRGEGIPEEEREMVFDKFYQCRRYGGPDGLGLGLSIVKGIVEMHRGETGLKIIEGEGTIFFFSVPVLKQGDESQ